MKTTRTMKSVHKTKNPSPRYPWDVWLSKSKLILRRGRDYSCQPHSMAQQVRNAASARGILVSVVLVDGTITVSHCRRG
jgi:hypothetical protein